MTTNYTTEEMAKILNVSEKEIPDIDEGIMPILLSLNAKGYKTIFSCEGHTDRTSYENRVSGYITFRKNYDFVLPPNHIRKGNEKYVKFWQSKTWQPFGQKAIYFFTSRKTCNEQKEKERLEFLAEWQKWADSLPPLK